MKEDSGESFIKGSNLLYHGPFSMLSKIVWLG
jgi:hypothetical protein